MDSDDDLAARLREICLALPEVTQRASHGVPTWFVRDKKSFAQLWAEGHHSDEFPHLWCADAYRAVAPATLIALLDAS